MASSGVVTSDILTTGNEATIAPARNGSIVMVDQDELHLGDPEAYKPGFSDLQGPEPTEEDFKTLRKIPGKMPTVAYTLCAVEFAERASYYGVSQVFANFVQFPLPIGGNGAGAPPVGSQKTAGALGRGLQASSGVTLSFKFLSYTLPILGGWVADTRWGRYKTVCVGVAICGISHVIMAAGAAPSLLQSGGGLAPFLVSMILLAFGAGLFKSNISPMLIDQNPHKRPYVKTLASGERVIIDPEATISRILLWFYMLVNVGAFFGLATSYCEKRVGFWLAFLTPAIIYFLLPILLVAMYKKTVKVKPQGNDLAMVTRIIGLAIKKNGIFKIGRAGFLDAAKPSAQVGEGHTSQTLPWSDKFVDDVKRTLTACQIFLFFPLFYLNDQGIGVVQSSQGGSMTTNGAPNDLLNNFNPLAIIVGIPILNYGLYPLLRKYNIKFGRIRRITLGFLLVAINGLIGTIIQYEVYQTSPCGYRATECAEADGTVSPITIWAQIPLYVLGAIGECFAQVTAYEVAYSRSAPNMKGLITAIFLFMQALAQAIGAAVTPALQDPYLIWVFAGPCIAGFVLTPTFYFLFRHLDHEDESKMGLYDLPKEEEDHGVDAEVAGRTVLEKKALGEKDGHLSPIVSEEGSGEKHEG